MSYRAATLLKPFIVVPPHVLTQQQVKETIGPVFELDARRLNVMLRVIENSRVDKRHLAFPLEHVIAPRPLWQVNREYQEKAIELGREAARGALDSAGLAPEEIDLLITVSCTGIMIPSIDAFLINELGMRRDTRRLPVTELGCAAGAAALSQAADYIRAYPDANVLVLAVELPSLTFQRGDNSPAHLISCALFGDGAAAAVVTGQARSGARIVSTMSHLFPSTYDAMGFDLRDSGFHIVLSKDVPNLIRAEIAGLTARFMERCNSKREDLAFFWIHPGGQKLLANIESELGLNGDDTRASWQVLSQYGNLSSATVLFIASEGWEARPAGKKELGLMAAFGPGFSAEMLLLEWN
jgi:alkylresorcinol/alkylpyrone synthase